MIKQFKKVFPETTDLGAVCSPLRVCPIGAHSDFQGGKVKGMTIDASVDMVKLLVRMAI
ncbi:galactokinase family protein [Ruoffia sp. FAM 24228]|uniref:galactokinase family protein n=1 Tax=Ruoffia sp. FAM 24228 TaxID=3259517 RepID=UPI003886071D